MDRSLPHPAKPGSASAKLRCALRAAGMWALVPALAMASTMPDAAPTRPADAAPTPVVGVWQPPAGLQQLPIWPRAAPDMDGWPHQAERVLTRSSPEALHGKFSEAVFDVSSPTLTVFPAQGTRTDAAVIVFPGGGFRGLAITLEGTEICHWVAAKGMTCILSKYRVPRSNHYHDSDCRCAITPEVPRALQDAQRTIRLVRSMARDLQINPHKIGVMGFSAGGYLGAQTSNIFAATYASVDAIDAVSSRPDFAILFFPGHLCRADATLDPGIRVSEATPPTFLLMAWDDPTNKTCNSSIYARALEAAGVPAELHFFAKGGHAFGLRRNRSPDRVWPALVENWLRDIEILGPS